MIVCEWLDGSAHFPGAFQRDPTDFLWPMLVLVRVWSCMPVLVYREGTQLMQSRRSVCCTGMPHDTAAHRLTRSSAAIGQRCLDSLKIKQENIAHIMSFIFISQHWHIYR